MKPGDVSKPLYVDGGVHLIELIAIQKYNDAPANYLAWIRTQWEEAREQKILKQALGNLRKNAKINVFGTKDTL